MVIYLDVLILINLYVTYFQILAVSVLTHRKVIWYRKLISAGIGGAASLCIFIPQDMVITLTNSVMLRYSVYSVRVRRIFEVYEERFVFAVCKLPVFRAYALRLAVCRSYENAFYKRHSIFRNRRYDGDFMHLCRLYGNENDKTDT